MVSVSPGTEGLKPGFTAPGFGHAVGDTKMLSRVMLQVERIIGLSSIAERIVLQKFAKEAKVI